MALTMTTAHSRRSLPSHFLAFGAILLGLFLVACGPPYQVISQASPNPFIGAKQFVVMPIDYTGLHIGGKTESEYESAKSDKQQDSFQGDKDGVNQAFQANLKSKALDNGMSVDVAAGEVKTFVIKPMVDFIEPGFYAYVAAHPSKVTMHVTITDSSGKELDKIIVEHQSQASIYNPASGGRLRSDGEALGAYVARYLKDRAAGTTK